MNDKWLSARLGEDRCDIDLLKVMSPDNFTINKEGLLICEYAFKGRLPIGETFNLLLFDIDIHDLEVVVGTLIEL